MIKAVLFDMDGVLIDAKEWHYETLNDALAVLGLNISRTEHLAVYIGLPDTQEGMLDRTRGLSPKLHDFLNALKQKMTYQVIVEKCRPVFHHEYAPRPPEAGGQAHGRVLQFRALDGRSDDAAVQPPEVS